MPRVSSSITCQGSNGADYNKTCPHHGGGGGGGEGGQRCKKCPSHSAALVKKNPQKSSVMLIWDENGKRMEGFSGVDHFKSKLFKHCRANVKVIISREVNLCLCISLILFTDPPVDERCRRVNFKQRLARKSTQSVRHNLRHDCKSSTVNSDHYQKSKQLGTSTKRGNTPGCFSLLPFYISIYYLLFHLLSILVSKEPAVIV